MKANEFVKKFGWERAKHILKHADKDHESFLADWISVSYSYYDKNMISIADLKRLVESWELVSKHGGLFAAKCQIESECPDLEFGELEYYDDGSVHLTHIKDLEQAIADVESCQ